MLQSLSIRDLVLIDRLDLTFQTGLCVLTGETGAGKSILLDSLNLTLGARADSSLVRPGARNAAVTADFALAADHPVHDLLAAHGIDDVDGNDGVGDHVTLRRVVGADGRSRAFVNDQPSSVGLIRQLGSRLVEIQGQFDQHGLMDASTHRATLDGYGGLAGPLAALERLYEAWQAAAAAHDRACRDAGRNAEEAAFLRHSVEELEALQPAAGEEAELAERRRTLMHREQLLEALTAAFDALSGADGAEDAIGDAVGKLERVVDKAAGRLGPMVESLESAAADIAEATSALQAFGDELQDDSERAEDVEARLFALRDVARKHGCEVDGLPALRETLAARLAALEGGAESMEHLAAAVAAARDAYVDAGEALRKRRGAAAAAFDASIAEELPPLKLEKAAFRTDVVPLDEADWGPSGMDRVAFTVATIPGMTPGPLAKVASGGELARLMLALKVVLARAGSAPTLVFDEVDNGVGGATAAAVGQRLARLGAEGQILVVTHSPQVAARGDHHWLVEKLDDPADRGDKPQTRVEKLADAARREEIARMLAGDTITDEARAAADRLIDVGMPAEGAA